MYFYLWMRLIIGIAESDNMLKVIILFLIIIILALLAIFSKEKEDGIGPE